MSAKVYIQVNDQKREATPEELAQFEKDRAAFAEQQRLLEAERKAKAEARESAIAKLQKLGLTVDEVQAAFGLQA